jgi:hypothetical protein
MLRPDSSRLSILGENFIFVIIKQIILLIYMFNEELRIGMANIAATIGSTINPSIQELLE